VRWSEPGGSKLTLVSRLRAATDLARIERELRRTPRRRSVEGLDHQGDRA
jgi:hypothetical protein